MHQVARVIKAEKENDIVSTLTFDTPLSNAQPGQFLMLWLPGFDEKPYSIAGTSPLCIAVGAVGPFSRKLAAMEKGGRVWLRGPYGKGFQLKGKKVLLVGGGYGFGPLRFLAEVAKKKRISAVAVCGARNKGLLMKKAGCETVFTTDDGSEGIKGNVIAAMKQEMEKSKFDAVYTCGPERMMAAVAREAKNSKVPHCQMLLERYMKCGIGICGHCCCGEKLVCIDGPAFGYEMLDNPEFCKTWRTKTGKREQL